jgi:hypothetical protein
MSETNTVYSKFRERLCSMKSGILTGKEGNCETKISILSAHSSNTPRGKRNLHDLGLNGRSSASERGIH